MLYLPVASQTHIHSSVPLTSSYLPCVHYQAGCSLVEEITPPVVCKLLGRVMSHLQVNNKWKSQSEHRPGPHGCPLTFMLVIFQAYPMGVLLQRHLEGLGDAILISAQALACRGQRVVYFVACLEPSASPPGSTAVPFTDHWVYYVPFRISSLHKCLYLTQDDLFLSYFYWLLQSAQLFLPHYPPLLKNENFIHSSFFQ